MTNIPIGYGSAQVVCGYSRGDVSAVLLEELGGGLLT
jgi:hypothetical protein